MVALVAGLCVQKPEGIEPTPLQPAEELKLSDFPEAFKSTLIVVGDNASDIEMQAVNEIADYLENETGNKPLIKKYSEISDEDKRNYNLIVVGTPKTNPLLEEVYAMTNATRVTEEFPGEGKGVLEILRNPWDESKAMLLVEGSDEWGVKGASGALAENQTFKDWKRIAVSEEGENLIFLENETYKFTWAPDQQDITQDTLVLEFTYSQFGEQLYFTVKINDDDFNPHDYLGMTFDKNGNGVIDLGFSDEPYGLWANNMTTAAALTERGLVFAELIPKRGPHTCKFSSAGYTFEVSLSKSELNLTKKTILLRICFGDNDVPYGKISAVCTGDNILSVKGVNN